MKKVSNKKTIRVLIIGMHDQIGGIETFLMNYYRHIDREKIQFDFINNYDSICFEDEIKKLKGQVFKITNLKKNPIKYYQELKKVIKENNYQIVHINMMSAANILPFIAAKKCGVKNIIAHSHNGATPAGLLRQILHKINKKVVLRYANHLFACSKVAGDWLFGTNKEVTIINNAIDLSVFKPNNDIRLSIRKELKVEDKFLIGHVGRFSYQKNHEFIIDMFYELQKKCDKVILLLIGTGELVEQVKQQAQRLNIYDKIIFLGTTNKVNDYLQAMDLFILPSRFEGLPVVGIEAQAANLKCLFSTNITKEAKITPETEFLDCETNIWVDYIANYLKEKQNKKHNQQISKDYDILYAAKKLEEIYQSMI